MRLFLTNIRLYKKNMFWKNYIQGYYQNKLIYYIRVLNRYKFNNIKFAKNIFNYE